jgi:hypothetical protein
MWCDPSPIILRRRDWEGKCRAVVALTAHAGSNRPEVQTLVMCEPPLRQLEIATGGSIDFHSAMPENRGVAAGVAVAIAAAKNGIG